MSNRFSALLEDNSFKSNKVTKSFDKSFDRNTSGFTNNFKRNNYQQQTKKEYEDNKLFLESKKKKVNEEELIKMLKNNEDFPSLNPVKTNKGEGCSLSFISSLEKQTETQSESHSKPVVKENIPVIKINRRQVIKDNREKYKMKLQMEKVVELYEKRKQTFIMNWGEDEYNKLFKFPKYDYDYFNRLDEEYEAMLEEEEEKEKEKEFIEYNEYYEYD
jgi:hypothetical protein